MHALIIIQLKNRLEQYRHLNVYKYLSILIAKKQLYIFSKKKNKKNELKIHGRSGGGGRIEP